ncbi:MAG TPA: cupin [Solirubrobacteraceae bacterium]|jgi:mannose-6-phosphate isomerase-like protein (cupin superfamily)|nr:cupin [Solirubrobacteraceae bacterium]
MDEQTPGPGAGLPREVHKPWGSELWWACTERYAAKILSIRAGQKLSVQYHREKDETSYLFSGRLLIEQGSSVESMRSSEMIAGGVWRNQPGVVHSLLALEDSLVFEVSTPQLEDVIRLQDRYGRADLDARGCSGT